MKNIILDTDIGPDCDDAGALALLNAYADMGLCRILAIGHCTSNPYGAGAIDAICRHYGRADVPIGTWMGRDFLNDGNCKRYNRAIAQRLPNRFRDTQPEDVVRVYRRALAQQGDNSVDFIAIGPLNAVSALLDSPPDDISPLTGRELVAAKVIRLTMMAGIFRPSDPARAAEAERLCGKTLEQYAEYNVVCDIAAARNVAENWLTPQFCLGWEAGLMETGASLAGMPADHPVRMAYELWSGGISRRCSWDPMTVLYAVEQNSALVKDSVPGQLRFTEEGYTAFVTEADGCDHFAELAASDDEIIAHIDSLLARG